VTKKTNPSKAYSVVAEREPGWWIISVPELDITTQARRLSEIEHNAAEAIAVWLDVDPAGVSVSFELSTPAPVRREMDEARQLLQEANGMQERAGDLAGDAVRILLDDLGLTMRDAAAVLGVSHQRVAQLAARRRRSVA
jgi:predicted RNase H-like HicB family nuclease